MARSTVFRFSGRAIDPLAAGRELDVRAVLTGRLTKAGDVLRAQAELVDVATGIPDLGRAAASGRRATSSRSRTRFRARSASTCVSSSAPPERRKVRAGSTRRTPRPIRLYLKGRFFWNKWTPDGMRAAIRFYESAIELDPSYARAWCGIADAFGVLGNIKAVPPAEAFPTREERGPPRPRARPEARRGARLPRHSCAASSTGSGPRPSASSWSAVRLSPGYATGRRWYGQLLSGMGRHEEAIAEARRALELDPLSVIIHTSRRRRPLLRAPLRRRPGLVDGLRHASGVPTRPRPAQGGAHFSAPAGSRAGRGRAA